MSFKEFFKNWKEFEGVLKNLRNSKELKKCKILMNLKELLLNFTEF